MLLAGGLLFGYLAWQQASRHERENASALFTQHLSDRAAVLDRAVREIAGELTRAAGLLGMNPSMSRAEFRVVVSDALDTHGFIRAIEWAPLVTDRASHEARARDEGHAQYAIHGTSDRSAAVEAGPPRYAPVFYVEPYAQNRRALGYDLLSEPQRQAALTTAAARSAMALTGVIDLVQETGERRGVLAVAPVLLAPHMRGKDGALAGFVVVVLRGQDLLGELSLLRGGDAMPRVLFELVDETGPPRLIARSAGWESHPRPPEEWSHRIDVGGRSWRLSGQPTNAFFGDRSSRQPLILGLAGFALWESLGLMVLALGIGAHREARREQDEIVRAALDSISEGIVVADSTGRCLLLNDAAVPVLGAHRVGEPLRTTAEWMSADGLTRMAHDELPWPRVLRGESASELEVLVQPAPATPGRWLSINAAPVRDAGGGIRAGVMTFRDISERVQQDASLRRLSNAIEQTADSIFITDSEGTIEYVNSGFELTTGYSRTEAVGQTPAILKSGRQDTRYYETLWATIKAGEVFSSTPINRKKGGQEFHAEQTITPIRDRSGRVTHFVSVVKDVTERIRQEERDIEMAYAARVQQRLYPFHPPVVDRLDIAALAVPAAETGGDYFDFLTMPDGRLGIVIGDVSGHGLGSAFIMAETRAFLRPLAEQHRDPADLLGRLNPWLYGDLADSGRYVTLSLLSLDGAEGLEYASAGHVPGCVIGRSGDVTSVLHSTGLPLGLFPESSYGASQALSLQPGDIIVLLTDGITEAEDPYGEAFGITRVIQVVSGCRQEPAREIARHVKEAVCSFRQGSPLADDLTIVVCKIAP